MPTTGNVWNWIGNTNTPDAYAYRVTFTCTTTIGTVPTAVPAAAVAAVPTTIVDHIMPITRPRIPRPRTPRIEEEVEENSVASEIQARTLEARRIRRALGIEQDLERLRTPLTVSDMHGVEIRIGTIVRLVGPINGNFTRFCQDFGSDFGDLLGMSLTVLGFGVTEGWTDRLGGERTFVKVRMPDGVRIKSFLCEHVLVINADTITAASSGEVEHLRQMMSFHFLPDDVSMSLNHLLSTRMFRHDEIQAWETHIAGFPRRSPRPDILSPHFNKKEQQDLTDEYKDIPNARYLVVGNYIEINRPSIGTATGYMLLYKVRGDSNRLIESVKEQREFLKIILSDPKRYTRAYGQHSGKCGLCHRPLDESSQHRVGLHYLCMDKQNWDLEDNNDEN